jgi:hypothetical protein
MAREGRGIERREFGKCNGRVHRRIILSSNAFLPCLLER